MGSNRPERARSLSRARRSGSSEEQRTLQYLAVCFLTRLPQPDRAQTRSAEEDLGDGATGPILGAPRG